VATDVDPQTPADLANDKDAEVRMRVARNSATSTEVLTKLASDE